jgi:hypothetical protein
LRVGGDTEKEESLSAIFRLEIANLKFLFRTDLFQPLIVEFVLTAVFIPIVEVLFLVLR